MKIILEERELIRVLSQVYQEKVTGVSVKRQRGNKYNYVIELETNGQVSGNT